MKRDPRSCEAWRLLLELFLSHRSHVPALAAELHLSEPQCLTLRLLVPGEALPMARLADSLGCDASNVTGIVDRLAARGLIERRSAAHDRRLKMVALTLPGAELRSRLLERLAEPPDPIARLSAADQAALATILRRALAATEQE
jgi:DNA-binding MarR family transcriptional regulator